MKLLNVILACAIAMLSCNIVHAADKVKQEEEIIVSVELSGVYIGDFILVSMPSIETEVIEYQDGDDLTLRKRPGRTRYSNAIIKRPLSSDLTLWNWYSTVLLGKVERKTVTFTLQDKNGSQLGTYSLFNAWPAKLQYGVFETVELTVERVVRVVDVNN